MVSNLQDLRGVEKTPGQEEQVAEEAVQRDEMASSVEKANTKLNPLRGVQELVKVIQAYLLAGSPQAPLSVLKCA